MTGRISFRRILTTGGMVILEGFVATACLRGRSRIRPTCASQSGVGVVRTLCELAILA